MFFFQYLIRLLVGNSDTLFMGLIMVIFGYYGWLLWNINDRFKRFFSNWERNEFTLKDLNCKIENLDESLYKDLISKINQNMLEINKLYNNIQGCTEELERNRREIIAEIKESEDDIKDIMKILLNHRSRSINPEKHTGDEVPELTGESEEPKPEIVE
ncbi:MAG: hypothetical protein MI740_08605 [Halanaerobiales bacterium]|nr:hypothetical protein [Halanaerobiales bacterium]